MKKLLPAVLALVLLSGCGASQSLTGARTLQPSQLGAKSKAGAEKGVRAIFKAAFVAADSNKNGYLSLDEMPLTPPGLGAPAEVPADAKAVQKAMMEKLDLNKDNKVGYREFSRPDVLQPVLTIFRYEVGQTFAKLDRNGDRLLTANEFDGSAFTLEKMDLSKNGKVTLSEFEDAFALTVGGGADPVDPTPVTPGPAPAPGGDTPPAPAPGGDEPPAPAPVPAPDEPAPGGDEPQEPTEI